MRYYLRSSSLIIRGTFRACSSGHNGGIRDCTTLLNHQVTPEFSGFPDLYVRDLVLSYGFSEKDTLCLLTAVPIQDLCVLTADPITVFITAGVTHPDPGDQEGPVRHPGAGTINIIILTRNFSDQALVDAVITATEAKVMGLMKSGYHFAGTVTDAVIIATEKPGTISYAGSATDAGQKIHGAVLFGICEALKRKNTGNSDNSPSLFVRSSIGGDHWVKWEKKGCPYYPCHFEGQRCEYCYCPLYPCGDTTLGDWIVKPEKEPVWGCTRCSLNHEPGITRHLMRNPEASLIELKAFFKKNNK